MIQPKAGALRCVLLVASQAISVNFLEKPSLVPEAHYYQVTRVTGSCYLPGDLCLSGRGSVVHCSGTPCMYV